MIDIKTRTAKNKVLTRSVPMRRSITFSPRQAEAYNGQQGDVGHHAPNPQRKKIEQVPPEADEAERQAQALTEQIQRVRP